MRRKSFGWRRIGLPLVIAGALIVAGASPANADFEEDDTYTVDIDGTTVGAAGDAYAGDANATIAVKITNLSSQKLGSANVTVPSPFTVVSTTGGTVAGQVLHLRTLGLAKNASITVALTVDVRTCAPATPAEFGVTARKTSDYSGSSAFTLKSPFDKQVHVIGKCGLAFEKQPQDAKKDTTITSVAFNPGGAAIKVIVVDAGNTGPAAFFTSITPIVLTAANSNVVNPMLTGTTSVAPTNGQASFAPKIGVSAFDYTFTATSTELNPSTPSSTFDIVDAQASCAINASCTATTPATTNGTTASATFNGGQSNTNLTLSIGAADAPNFECKGYPKGGSPVSQFGFTGDLGGDRTGTFSVTIPNASWFVILYQVCWASPVDFYTKFGKWASAGVPDLGDGTPKPGTTSGETLKVGLLPNCKKWWWNDRWSWDPHWDFPNPTVETLPCISSRTYNWSTKSVTIEVRTTGADPWRY